MTLGQQDMTRLLTIVALLGLALLPTGCQSKSDLSWYRDGWRGFSYAEAESYLNNFKNVILVCITQDHVEDLDPKKPESWSVLCFSGTVVRTYKGDWSVGERISFAHALDSRVKKQKNVRVGALMFLYTDIHTDTQFGVETGGFEKYDPGTDRLLQSVYPESVNNCRCPNDLQLTK